MYRVIKFTGALDSNCTVTIAPNSAAAFFIFINATTDSGSSGPYSLIFTQGSGANVTVVNGKSAVVYADGAGSGAAVINALDKPLFGTISATADTAAGDAASMGYTASEGLILTGQGSTNDVTIKNDADADVITIATGGTSVDIVGDVTASTLNADGDTSAGDNAAMGYTAAEGLILTGQGSTNDITIKNDADGEVCGVPTGTDDLRFPDDAQLQLGTGGDLTVHWDGTDGHISVAGTLNIDGSGETMATFVDDGAVTLYHNNVAKLATSAVGTTITGTLIATTDTDTSNTGSVTLDFGANQNFVLTLTGNVTLANPSTEQVGQAGVMVFIQDGTGSRTLSLGTDYETAGGAGITLSTAASAVDVVPYFVKASGSIQLGAVQKAFS
tara:strand:- start:1831 stop:2988 length:1158 start_codon:yes stop_codon:yes gene_type:complete